MSAGRIDALRARLKTDGLNGFLIPRADEFQGEEVPACSERLAWLTGFTGSAGLAVVLNDKAALFSDSRYTIQMKQQVDGDVFEFQDVQETSPSKWLESHVKDGDVIGYDPKLHTKKSIAAYRRAVEKAGAELRAVDENPVDAIWTDRPHPPMEGAYPWPEKYAGKSAAEKRGGIAETLKKNNCSSVVLTAPDSVAWLLNVRGKDLKHTPVALSYAILKDDGQAIWFIEPERVHPDLYDILGHDVRMIGPHALAHELELAARDSKYRGKAVMLDPARSPVWFFNALKSHGADIKEHEDPCIKPRAIKNVAEQNAMRDAHKRDGLALIRFLCWLDHTVAAGQAFTEIDAEDKLEEFRAKDPYFKGPSFDTIAGFNANGAIVHYRATPETALEIKAPGLLLVDSGGQYEDGTTDVTRTIAIGEPTQEMRECYTLVLKGHFAVASAKFPKGVPGSVVDAFACRPLWEAGLEYGHGTGHGVGCFLSVHEDGCSLSPRSVEGFKAGMIVSNEPGYYKEGAFGVRIENLLLAIDTGRKSSANSAMLAFEDLTLAPYDRRLIIGEMLDQKEKDQLNAYHRRVWDTYRGNLDKETSDWLQAATAPL